MQWEGLDIARYNVARLMPNRGLQRVIRGKPVRTSIGHDEFGRQTFNQGGGLWFIALLSGWQGGLHKAIQATHGRYLGSER